MENMEVQEADKKVLEGVTVYVAKKLSPGAKEIHRVVESLGGKVTYQNGDRVTHLIFTGKQNDMTKEFRTARDKGAHVVAPDWVYMCRDEARKVEEELFPHTFNPRMKLDITGGSPSLSQSQLGRSRERSGKRTAKPPLMSQAKFDEEDEDGESPPKRARSEDEENSLAPQTPPPVTNSEVVSADLAEMESLLDSVAKTPLPTSGRKVLRTVLSNPGSKRGSDVGMESDAKAGDTEEEDEDKQSQVRWVDPEEEAERKRLQVQVNALETQDLAVGGGIVSQDTMAGMDTMGSMMAGMETIGSINMQEDGNKENQKTRNPADFVFMVSGVADDVINNAVAKLGGKVSESQSAGQFDMAVTHMVTSKVSRSEKMLCSVASGRWVLHSSYIEASLEAGRWLEEELYEWGAPQTGFLQLEDGSTESKLAVAARRWRLQGRGQEAFAGMSIIFIMPQNKRDQFQRLVIAGGGKVLEARSPYSNVEGVTHLLTETRYLGKDKVDYAGLAVRGVPVLKPLYLNDFLVSSTPPSLDTFMLEEYKDFWEKKKRSRVITDTPTNPQKKTKSVLAEI